MFDMKPISFGKRGATKTIKTMYLHSTKFSMYHDTIIQEYHIATAISICSIKTILMHS